MAEKKSEKKSKKSKSDQAKQRTMSRMNPNQKEAVIAFMESHSELLSASVSKLYSREIVDNLWMVLTQLLNDLGQVAKATSTWKKTWFDMKREVKAKLGPPPYPPHLLATPDDQSTMGQRGRIAALMTQAVRICQQHAATSLDSLQHNADEESGGESGGDSIRASPGPVEISVKCEPPDFVDYDIGGAADDVVPLENGAAEDQDGEPPAKRPRREDNTTEAKFAAALHMLAASQDRTALAMEGIAEAARGLSEVFRRRTAVEIEKVEALKQIACAIRGRPY